MSNDHPLLLSSAITVITIDRKELIN